jgi:hypothetical protein
MSTVRSTPQGYALLADSKEDKSEAREAVIENAQHRQDLTLFKPATFARQIIHKTMIPHPFAEIAEQMSQVKTYFPLMLPLIFTFPEDFPERVEMGKTDVLLNREFHCHKDVLENAPGSRFKYAIVEYDHNHLHLTIQQVQQLGNSVFKNYYNTVIAEANPKNPNQTLVHYETGYSAGNIITSYLANNFMYPVLSGSDKMALKHFYRWAQAPQDAARRRIFKQELRVSKPLETDDHEYMAEATLACSTSQMFALLHDHERMAKKVVTGSYDEKSQILSREFQPIGKVKLHRRELKGSALSLVASGFTYKLNIDFLVLHAKDNDVKKSRVVVRTAASTILANIPQVKVLLNENLINTTSTMFAHLINEAEREHKVAKITPDLDLQKGLSDALKKSFRF